MIDHCHHLASDKWENVLPELAVHHTQPVFVRRRLPLLNPFKVDKHERHAVVFRIDQQRLRRDLFATDICVCLDLDWRDIRKLAFPCGHRSSSSCDAVSCATKCLPYTIRSVCLLFVFIGSKHTCRDIHILLPPSRSSSARVERYMCSFQARLLSLQRWERSVIDHFKRGVAPTAASSQFLVFSRVA